MGEGFIHVHHLLDLSLVQPGKRVDGVKDLRPVCPNCHAMLHHKSRPARSIEWLKNQIKQDPV
jgi:5-methylcytosine-specific restriction protein A